MTYPKFEIIHLTCTCSDVEHTLRFMCDPEDPECLIYTEIALTQYHGFWKRVWLAVKYVFGRQADCGHFDCFMMETGEQMILKNFLENAVMRKLRPNDKTPE